MGIYPHSATPFLNEHILLLPRVAEIFMGIHPPFAPRSGGKKLWAIGLSRTAPSKTWHAAVERKEEHSATK